MREVAPAPAWTLTGPASGPIRAIPDLILIELFTIVCSKVVYRQCTILYRQAPTEIKYLISLYVTFTTLTTVGYGDITMRTSPELIFGIIMMALGASTFAVIVGNMAALLGKMDLRATAFKAPSPPLSPQAPLPEVGATCRRSWSR